ncbi:MAG TPA: GNAT family N-acetyltransferase [Armatimonadota bacterium]|jgi:tagatose 1,6-diphosphate aldolase
MPDAGEFTFRNIGTLTDGELELYLVRTIPGDPARAWLPTYDFEMYVDGLPAGNINIRIGNTPLVVMYAGHIGYAVEPEFRGHHYAERACRLLLPLAKAHGMTTLWITTNPDNSASRRTCERLGAVLVELVPVPENTDLYTLGDREKCRYRLDL